MDLTKGYTRLIADECRKQGLLRNQCANVLAQVNWETGGTMMPVRETFATSDQTAKTRLTKAWKAGKLPWVKRDYWSSGFFGRGFIQLTHESNYRKAGKAVGVDLVAKPSLALDPVISAKTTIMGMRDGWFTGKKLSDYITLSRSDFTAARAIVNGDKNKKPSGSRQTIGQIIAERSRAYDKLLLAAGYGIEKTPEKPASTREAPPTHKTPPKAKPAPVKPHGGRAGILAIIAAAVVGAGAWVSTQLCDWIGVLCS